MTKLPRISGKEAIRALEKCCIVPVHGSKIIKPGTLYSVLKGAGLSGEEFLKSLK